MSTVSSSGTKNLIVVGGVIAAIAISLFAYLMFFTAPETVQERVKVIAVTQEGCIAETFDGYAMNIGQCNAEPGQFVMAEIDQKVKERAAAMNPTK